jgi:adenylyltransferase/sulfurtransferase
MIKRDKYFRKQIELWGKERQNLLQTRKIVIIGAGGLGCSLAYSLGTSGIGEIDIVDFDKVSIDNIHRQIVFTLQDIGKYKSEIIVESIKSKNPFLKASAYTVPFHEFQTLDYKYDLILDATDNLETREEIDFYAKVSDTPWIYGSVEKFNGQVCFFKKGKFAIFNSTQQRVEGVAAPMVIHIASLQANFALRYLLEFPIVTDKLYYLYFNTNGELITKRFNIPT